MKGLLFVSLFICTNILAKDIVTKGFVADGETMLPFQFIAVYIEGDTQGTFTNAAGYFALKYRRANKSETLFL